MPLSATNWDAIIAGYEARIQALLASNNPDYSVAGRTLSKGAYLEQLMRGIDMAKHLRQDADGAWSFESKGVC